MVRPVIFLAYSGEMRWRTRAGDEITATLGTPMTKDQIAQAWRTALDPAGEWVSRVLEAADKRLTEVRRGMPDAGGLVIAGDHEDARAYAALLRGLTGKRPVVVLSDDKTASKKISSFADLGRPLDGRGADGLRGRGHPAAGRRRVRDQRVHRPVLRPGGRPVRPGPAAGGDRVGVPPVGSRAAVLRRRTRGRTGPRAPAPRRRDARGGLCSPRRSGSAIPRSAFDEPAFQALNASAHFDRVLYDGGEFGTATAAGSPEEEDFLGLPGLLDPDQVRTLLRKRQDAQLAARSATAAPAPQAPSAPRTPTAPNAISAPTSPYTTSAPPAPPAAPPVSRQALAALRKELNGLVGAWSHRTGQPHGVIHAELRRTCGGPPLPQATADQIRARIDTIRRWAISGR